MTKTEYDKLVHAWIGLKPNQVTTAEWGAIWAELTRGITIRNVIKYPKREPIKWDVTPDLAGIDTPW